MMHTSIKDGKQDSVLLWNDFTAMFVVKVRETYLTDIRILELKMSCFKFRPSVPPDRALAGTNPSSDI